MDNAQDKNAQQAPAEDKKADGADEQSKDHLNIKVKSQVSL